MIKMKKLLAEGTWKYPKLWKDFEVWVEKNKYPAWKHQRNWIVQNASKYGINKSPEEIKKILARYDELQKKGYFVGWDMDAIPWIEKNLGK